MEKIKYLYIEDEKDENIGSYKEKLESSNIIEIEYYKIKKIDELLEIIKSKNNKIDGILIDFRLDEEIGFNFNAPSIIQEFRQKVADEEDGFIDVPVVLISTDEKIKHLYNKETTSHDLFDSYILKGRLTRDNEYKEKKVKELTGLSEGYKRIRKIKESYKDTQGIKDEIIKEILNLDDNQNYIDTSIFGRLLNKPFSPEHEYANFIIKNLLKYNGYLIDELTLGARLGISVVDLTLEEKEEWEKIKSFFNDAKYTGVFSEGWERWWMERINEKFEEISEGIYLIELNAEKRVEILKEKLSLTYIKPAKPIKCNNSTEFWVVCEKLKRPLDTIEGFKVATEKELFPWQEPKYYSFYALINYIFTDVKNIKEHLHPDEWDRFFEMLKERKEKCE